MPALYNADEIIEIAGGRLGQGMLDEEPGSICTDTRRLVEGSWFLALNGHEFDGHDFLGDAYCRGARGCIVEERHNYPIATSSFPLIVVPDTTFALRDLARNWRRRLAFKIVLVVSDDRNRSGEVARRISEKLALQSPTSLVDVTREGTTASLELLLNSDQDTSFIALNLAPDNLEEAAILAMAYSADVSVFVGEPFDYMRLTAAPEAVKAAFETIVGSMDRKRTCIIAAGSAQHMLSATSVPPGAVVFVLDPSDLAEQAEERSNSDVQEPSVVERSTPEVQEPSVVAEAERSIPERLEESSVTAIDRSIDDYCVYEATRFFLEPDGTVTGGMIFEP